MYGHLNFDIWGGQRNNAKSFDELTSETTKLQRDFILILADLFLESCEKMRK